MSRLAAEQWSEYWKAGPVTTFQNLFSGNYDGEVAAFWREIFEKAPAGARIVDLACGNGALALLAAEYSRESGRDLSIDAVDFAQIYPPADPAARELTDLVNFLPGRPMEHTGLDGNRYDLAISQFGVEYGKRGATADELDRILKREGARLALMCHTGESRVIEQAREALEQAEQCESSRAAEIARKLQTKLSQLLSAGKNPAKDRACERLRARLNEATGKLHLAANRFADPYHIHFFLRGCLAPFSDMNTRRPLQQRLALLDQLEQECSAFESRMRDLLSAAMSQEDFEAWTAELQARGFTRERSEPVVMADKLFAQVMVFSR